MINKLIDDLEQEDTIDYDKIKLLLAERDIGAAEADVIDEKMPNASCWLGKSIKISQYKIQC